ncbi:MAG: hypothetical protein E6R06_03975 [Mycobacterium sp.]|nr:MAG: hypothetical protein E6R06_03975 [Mycobacterium sp.]
MKIIKALELYGPADWKSLRDCHVGNPYRPMMPSAMKILVDGGHIRHRVVPDRKYRLVVFERGTGLPEWIDRDLYDAARSTHMAGIRRRKLAPMKTTRSKR